MTDGLRLAPPTRHGDVIDGHVHLFSVAIVEEMVRAFPEAERFRQAARTRKWGRRGENWSLPDLPAEDMAVWYAERMRDAGVAKALVVSVVPDSQYTRDFIAAAKGHVQALCTLDPRRPDAAELLEREMAAGFKGVKLLPVNHCYRVSDPACRPFFEKAAELKVPMIIHYGITVDPRGDLHYADPLDLSPVARDFSELPFVIAHFGAGFLTQSLQVCYQCKNVALDTSGTNNWMDYVAEELTLPRVFEKVLGAVGPERVMFGTDSGTTAPYRKWIKFQQTRILEELALTEHDKDLVLRGNAARIFHMDE